MIAGQLRHRLIIEQPHTSQNSTGEEVVAWELVKVAWASIEPLRGRERLQANQPGSELDTRIRVRWSPNLDAMTAKWRLRHRGVIYNIAAPPANVDMRDREIEIMASSGINIG